jgi:hypothetical protein
MSDRNVIDFQSASHAKHPPEDEDEIVLSTTESPMPKGVTGDWAAEAAADRYGADAGRGEKEQGQARGWQRIWSSLQWPEQWLWHRYAESRMHQHLHKSQQWYRNLQERWQAELDPQDAENADVKPRHRLHGFVARNPVTAVLLCLLAVYAGRTGINYLLEAPVRRETVAVAPRKASPAAPVVQKTTPLPTADLEHCSLSPTLRDVIAPVDRATKHAVLTEINRLHFSFAASGIEQQWQQLMIRRRLTKDIARQVLPLAAAHHARLDSDRARLLSQREELVRSLDAAQASNRYDVDDVNRRIKRRGALERTESVLAAGPTSAQLAVLGDAIKALRRRMGDVEAGSAADESMSTQREIFWAAAVQEMPPEQMKQELDRLFQRYISEPVAAGKAETSAVNRYRLDRIISALDSINQLIDLQNEAASTLPNLDVEQTEINNRLAELLGTPAAGGLLNYRACLSGHMADQASSSR